MKTENTAVVHWTSGSLVNKVRVAEQFVSTIKETIDNLPDATNDVLESLWCLLTVGSDYLTALKDMRVHKVAEEETYYRLRNANMLAAVLLQELIEDEQDELADWYYGASDEHSMIWLTANVLTDALQTFTKTMLYGRKLNYDPLTDAEAAAIQRLIK